MNILKNKTLTTILFIAFIAVGAFSLISDFSYGTYGAEIAHAVFDNSICCNNVMLDGGGGGFGGGFGGAVMDGGGGGGGGGSITPYCTLTLTAGPVQSQSYPPQTQYILAWSSPYATSFSINNGIGAVTPATAGTKTFVTSSTPGVYTGTAVTPYGTVTCQTVPLPTPPPVPVCELELTKDMISWSTTGANVVNIVPLTNSPQVPGASIGGQIVETTYTETQVYQSQAVIAELAQNGITLGSVQWNTGFQADQPTMTRVCQLLHGPNASLVTYAYDKYGSPGDNAMLLYSGSSWTYIPGYHKYHLRGSITCSKPATQSTYPLSGYHNFVPPLGVGTHTYQLTATGPGGAAQCTKTVVVPPSVPLACDIYANPDEIQQGNSSTLTWSSTGATNCVGQNFSTGGSTSGSSSVSPNMSTNYAITCSKPVVQTGTGTWSLYEDDYTDYFCQANGMDNPNTNGLYKAYAGVPNCSNVNPQGTACANPQGICKVNSGQCVIHTKLYRCDAPSGTTGGSYGATETVQCQTSVTVKPKPAAPTCTLMTDPETITKGGSTKLKWTTTNGTSISIDEGIGNVTPVASGYKTVSPTVTTSYKATVTGPGGTADCHATVIVQDPPPPVCELTISPGMCTSSNNLVVLEWTTLNATSLVINNGVGSVSPVGHGTKNLYPTQTTQFVGTVTGPGGTAQCDVTVVVVPPPPPKVPSCTLSASDETITLGESVTLSWVSANVTSGSIDNGVGATTPVASGSKSASPTQTTTYKATFTGPNGSVTCSKKVTVNPPPPSAPTCTLTGVPETITTVGGSATIKWTTTNATSVTFDNGIGSVTPVASGSKTVAPSDTTTYKATVTGPGGTIKCYVTIKVQCDLPPPPPKDPVCTLSSSADTIALGESVNLSWTSANVTSGTIDNGVGSISPIALGSKTVSPTQTTYYKATFTGPHGNVSCTKKVIVSTTPPTCTLKSSKPMCSPNESVGLEWETTNATSFTIDNGVGSVTPVASGTKNVSVNQTTTYTGTATGPGGTVQCDTTIVVKKPKVPSCALTVSDASITEGESVTLSWESANVSSGNIDHGVGDATPVASGSELVTPSETTTYLATFAGPHGSVQCSVKVKVKTKVYDKPECTLDSNPGTIDQGQSSVLTWTTKNATTISIDQGVGSVTPVIGGTKSVSPAETTYYTATATGPGGTVQCMTKVKVTPKPNAPTCTMSINPTAVGYGGAAVLTWTSTNVTQASINQSIGSVAVNDSKSVSNLTSATTYTGTFTGPGGTVTCNATVTVDSPPTPVCSLSINKSQINPGESVKVSWTSANVSNGTISPMIGSASPVTSGTSIDVFPSDDTTFTGTFTGPHGNVSCSVFVDVRTNVGCTSNCGGGGLNPPTVELFKQPTEQQLAFVYLSQVPYTGFEAGPALTLIFWLAIALASATVAYFVTGAAGIRYLMGSVMSYAGLPHANVSRYDEQDSIPERRDTYGVEYPYNEDSASTAHVASQAVVAPVAYTVMNAPIAVAPRPQPVMLPEPVVVSSKPKLVVDGIPAIEDVIEARAHAAGVLISPEAITSASNLSGNREVALRLFGTILNEAVRTIPREDGWVMLTSDRFETLKVSTKAFADTEVVQSVQRATVDQLSIATEPVTSLNVSESAAAEFVVAILGRDRETTYAIVRAMEHDQVSPTSLIIGVASVLDRLYRVRHGGKNGLDKALLEKSANVSDETISKLVEVFTHALDTVYPSPFTAVKLALAQAFEIVG